MLDEQAEDSPRDPVQPDPLKQAHPVSKDSEQESQQSTEEDTQPHFSTPDGCLSAASDADPRSALPEALGQTRQDFYPGLRTAATVNEQVLSASTSQTQAIKKRDSNIVKATYEGFDRELNGAIVRFDDGASIRDVSFLSEYSAIFVKASPGEQLPLIYYGADSRYRASCG